MTKPGEAREPNGGPKPGEPPDKNSVEAGFASQVCRLVHTFMCRIMARSFPRRDLSGAVSSRTSPRRRWRGVFLERNRCAL